MGYRATSGLGAIVLVMLAACSDDSSPLDGSGSARQTATSSSSGSSGSSGDTGQSSKEVAPAAEICVSTINQYRDERSDLGGAELSVNG